MAPAAAAVVAPVPPLASGTVLSVATVPSPKAVRAVATLVSSDRLFAPRIAPRLPSAAVAVLAPVPPSAIASGLGLATTWAMPPSDTTQLAKVPEPLAPATCTVIAPVSPSKAVTLPSMKTFAGSPAAAMRTGWPTPNGRWAATVSDFAPVPTVSEVVEGLCQAFATCSTIFSRALGKPVCSLA